MPSGKRAILGRVKDEAALLESLPIHLTLERSLARAELESSLRDYGVAKARPYNYGLYVLRTYLLLLAIYSIALIIAWEQTRMFSKQAGADYPLSIVVILVFVSIILWMSLRSTRSTARTHYEQSRARREDALKRAVEAEVLLRIEHRQQSSDVVESKVDGSSDGHRSGLTAWLKQLLR